MPGVPHGTTARCRPVEPVAAAAARRSRASGPSSAAELGRLDAVCLLISAILVLDTLAASILATGWSALAMAAALWPGLGTAHPDIHLPDGFSGDRLGFTLAELVPLAAVLTAPSLPARWGRRRRRRPLKRVADEALWPSGGLESPHSIYANCTMCPEPSLATIRADRAKN